VSELGHDSQDRCDLFNDRQSLDNLIALIDRTIGGAGYECLDAEWVPGERVLRLFVDRIEKDESGKGIDLDGCAAVNALLAEFQELDDLIPGAYTLEVSSPGIERPLRRKSHFEQHIGETVQVRLAAGGDQPKRKRQLTGRLVAVSGDDRLTIETDGGPMSFPLEQVQKASLVYDWSNHF